MRVQPRVARRLDAVIRQLSARGLPNVQSSASTWSSIPLHTTRVSLSLQGRPDTIHYACEPGEKQANLFPNACQCPDAEWLPHDMRNKAAWRPRRALSYSAVPEHVPTFGSLLHACVCFPIPMKPAFSKIPGGAPAGYFLPPHTAVLGRPFSKG